MPFLVLLHAIVITRDGKRMQIKMVKNAIKNAKKWPMMQIKNANKLRKYGKFKRDTYNSELHLPTFLILDYMIIIYLYLYMITFVII